MHFDRSFRPVFWFVRRFADMEQQAKAQGKQLSELTLEEMDALWDEAKKKEHRE